ncbi:unnamed protein product [Chrysoparadoxa australica]
MNEGWVVIFAGLCSLGAILSTASLIMQHRNHFTRPDLQGKICGILWMVPIYSVNSWLSLKFKAAALYLDMARDCYEAYALYLFLALLVGYLGDTSGDESAVVDLLEHLPRIQHKPPISFFFPGFIPHGRFFLRWAKFGLLQFAFCKPAAGALALILSPIGLYDDGSWNPTSGWIWLTLIVNSSVSWAFYCLATFYFYLRLPLSRFNPVPKFLCIKAVLFLSFWQGVLLSLITRLDWIHAYQGMSAEAMQTLIRDSLICLEMLALSVAHHWAFPVEPYMTGTSVDCSLLEAHFGQRSAIRDWNEVMPVWLPSTFKPGPARFTMRSPLLALSDVEDDGVDPIEPGLGLLLGVKEHHVQG